MIGRFLAVLRARNLEFFRDRSALAWNLVMPLALVVAMALIFSGEGRAMFQVAVLDPAAELEPSSHPFLGTRHIEFFAAAERERTFTKLSRHQVDMVIELRPSARFWVNPESAKGYFLERVLRGSEEGDAFVKGEVTGKAVRYVDWLLPGILGMNMMFSALFGVGYVVVRYRKSGFLRRLNATPLRAVEFVAAQMVSRVLLVVAVNVVVYALAASLIGFQCAGSFLLLGVLATLGALCMVAIGLVLASRVASEELAGGLVNLVSWPMMLLSGVWFSLEGSHASIQQAAEWLPLTQMLDGARAVMLDGAGWSDVSRHLIVLAAQSALFLALGAALFRWRQD